MEGDEGEGGVGGWGGCELGVGVMGVWGCGELVACAKGTGNGKVSGLGSVGGGMTNRSSFVHDV